MKRTSKLPTFRFFIILLGIVACLSLTSPATAGTNACLSCHSNPERLKASMGTSVQTQDVTGCRSIDPKAEG